MTVIPRDVIHWLTWRQRESTLSVATRCQVTDTAQVKKIKTKKSNDSMRNGKKKKKAPHRFWMAKNGQSEMENVLQKNKRGGRLSVTASESLSVCVTWKFAFQSANKEKRAETETDKTKRIPFGIVRQSQLCVVDGRSLFTVDII